MRHRIAHKNEDYILKQTLLWIEFSQHQDGSDAATKERLKQADEQTLQTIVDYLQISDRAIVDFIVNFFYGLLLRRLFGEETFSFTQQGKLLTQMLTAYLEKKQPEILL